MSKFFETLSVWFPFHLKIQMFSRLAPLIRVNKHKRVKLNVGGQSFTTSYSTIEKSRKLSQEVNVKKSNFIDRDPTHFPIVLNHLRGDDVGPILPLDHIALQEIKQQSDWYELDGLSRIISNKLSPVCMDMKHVKLNIGGYRYETRLSTLKGAPALYDIICKELKTDDNDQWIFIDRNGEPYKHILNYLRDPNAAKYLFPNDMKSRKALESEAEYCGVEALVSQKSQHYIDSCMDLTDEEQKLLRKWIHEGDRRTFDLLYRASEHDFSAATFHEKCDNRGSTLTLVQSEQGYIYGGYTDVCWQSSGGWKYDTNRRTCVFLLRSQKADQPRSWKLKDEYKQYEVYRVSDRGPRFRNIIILDKCNKTNQSDAFVSSSYNSAPDDANILAGSQQHQINQYEVFLVGSEIN
eukprot:435246_1